MFHTTDETLCFSDGLVDIPVPHVRNNQHILAPTEDKLHDYTMALLRTGMEFILVDDVIKAADVDRQTIIMKRLLPTFVSLTSYHSKYAIECINFLTKTETIMSEKESTRVKLQGFVNTKGLAGHNKAADLQQENNIKEVKSVIKGLGAGKTDKAMQRISKAAPVVVAMSDNLESQLGMKSTAARNRTPKSSAEDHEKLHNHLRRLQPLQLTPGRMLGAYNESPSVLSKIDVFKMKEFIIRNRDRTINRFHDLEDNL